MLENPPPHLAGDPPPPAAVRRYAPPNQRNRLGRRKSGGSGDANRNVPRNFPASDLRDIGIGNFPSENLHSGLIPLEGCCNSEAYQLLSDRWATAVHSCNDPSVDSPERPVMYSGSTASVWGHVRLPHQLMSPGGVGSPGSQMDFMAELQRAMGGV